MHYWVLPFFIINFLIFDVKSQINRNYQSTADHSQFTQLSYSQNHDLVKNCNKCHNNAHEHVAKTIHWTDGCTRSNSNENRVIVTGDQTHLESTDCMSCHTGFSKVHISEKKRADCLTCHDNSGLYDIHQKTIDPQKFKKIVKSIGTPSRQTCGKCHFHDFINNRSSQYGDLTPELKSPTKNIDVHMDRDGNNFNCQNCHYTINHKMSGKRNEKTTKQFIIRGAENKMGEIASCEACHTKAPHKSKTYMDHHVKYISCQTCHIPKLAKGNSSVPVHHNWQNKNLKTDTNITPSYHWGNGNYKQLKLSDTIDPNSKEIKLNVPAGNFMGANVKIYPFMEFTSLRPYDSKTNQLLIPSELPNTANASPSVWNQKFQEGMKILGKTYSGESSWIKTKAYFYAHHMVAPKKETLKCIDCHSNNSILSNIDELYIPGRDRNIWDYLGWGLIILNLIGVSIHTTGRIFSKTTKKILTKLTNLLTRKNKDERKNHNL